MGYLGFLGFKMADKKRGEITSKQLVTIIILIVSFSVILIFFFSLDLQRGISDDACRNSVILRSKLPVIGEGVKLNCKTNYICISREDECKESTKDTTTIKVKDKNEIIEALADLMRDCWWKMGEGDVDYSRGVDLTTENYCAVCDVVHFDESIKNNEELNKLTYKEFYFYLSNKKVPNKDESYLYYLTGFSDLTSERARLLQSEEKVDIFDEKYFFNLADDKGYALVTGISKKGWRNTLGSALGAGGVLAFIGGVVGNVPGAVIGLVLGGGGTGTVAYYIEKPGSIQQMYPVFIQYDAKSLENLNCKEFSTLA